MTHETFLLKTLQLAESRRGFCSPNPCVGAVLVKNNQIIAEGAHFQAGYPHAEPTVIDKVGADARNATLYVSLEPCNHWGKTPPCTDKIIASGIKEVFFSHCDTHALVSNKTIALLEQANIPCKYIPLEAAKAFYESYDYWLQHRKPFVTAKLAVSLDGKIANGDGSPIKITGQALQCLTHELRKKSDILLTTQKTLINDNPMFNVRLGEQSIAKPIAVLAKDGTLPSSLKIFQTAAKILIFFDENQSLTNKLPGVEYYGIPATHKELNLMAVINILGELGYHDVWIEAGGKCFSNFLQQRLINRAYLYFGGIWLGQDATPAFTFESDFVPKPSEISWRSFGQDCLCCLEF